MIGESENYCYPPSPGGEIIAPSLAVMRLGEQHVLYQMFDLGQAAFGPARAAADTVRMLLNNPFNPFAHTTMGRSTAAACEVFERTTRRYGKPQFGIASTVINGETVPVRERVVWETPFCRLIQFARGTTPDAPSSAPRMLLVAPMSGHYATLLRGTVESLLPEHEVFITDWVDASTVPVDAGRFDLEDYIDHMMAIFRLFEGDVHALAVCQPSIPVLAAVARMEQDNEPFVPRSMMLMGGPIDTRINQTAVNRLAQERGTEWFRRHVIATVPWSYSGRGREVYPGFLQLTGFMTMNLDRHIKAHKDLFIHLVRGDGDSADKHKEFYDEYLAVMDLTAEFYLQTIESVFVKHEMARGLMQHRGRLLDLGAITRVPLMTIEGENDDITGIGQCQAAHALCSGLQATQREHYEQAGVGHYGVFNGSRYRKEIRPRMSQFMQRFEPEGAVPRMLPEALRPDLDRRGMGDAWHADPAPVAWPWTPWRQGQGRQEPAPFDPATPPFVGLSATV
jgi:poly(3-hydroxybutyrate) depolymerase